MFLIELESLEGMSAFIAPGEVQAVLPYALEDMYGSAILLKGPCHGDGRTVYVVNSTKYVSVRIQKALAAKLSLG